MLGWKSWNCVLSTDLKIKNLTVDTVQKSSDGWQIYMNSYITYLNTDYSTCPGKPPAHWKGKVSFGLSLEEVFWFSAVRPVCECSAEQWCKHEPQAEATVEAGDKSWFSADFRHTCSAEQDNECHHYSSCACVQPRPNNTAALNTLKIMLSWQLCSVKSLWLAEFDHFRT